MLAVAKAKTAKVVPNAVEITSAGDRKDFFSSFIQQDKAYRLICAAWCNSCPAAVDFFRLQQEEREAKEKAAAAERDAALEAANARLLAATIEEASVTRLFTRSTALSDAAVVDFVTQLAAVSLAELQAVVIAPKDFVGVGTKAPPPSRPGLAAVTASAVLAQVTMGGEAPSLRRQSSLR